MLCVDTFDFDDTEDWDDEAEAIYTGRICNGFVVWHRMRDIGFDSLEVI